MSSKHILELMVPGTKRTLSAVLTKLPNYGVGSRVVKDTWLQYGDSWYDITKVVAHKSTPHLVDVWGHKTFKGQRLSEKPQKITAVWKWGWTWLPRPEEKARLEAYLQLNPEAAPVAAPVPNPVHLAQYQLRPSKVAKADKKT